MELPQIKHFHKPLIVVFLLLIVLANCGFSFPSEPQGKRQWHMTSDVKEVAGKSYDYIIVGGGTCGCPLAATLSEKFSVLLIERGGSPYGNPLVIDRRYYGFPLIQKDNNHMSVAQRFTSEEGVSNVRGRVLGGSSAINGGFYSRASDEFVDKVGWDKKLVKEAYEWVESKVVFPPFFLTPWQSVAEFSLLETGILPYNGYSLEHIRGTKISGSVFDGFGKRHTSADLLEAGNPKNLTVLVNATVKKIIFHYNGDKNETRAKGIKFIKSNGSLDETYEAFIKKPNHSTSRGDVILSAGALGSPQLLLLSGIGPKEQLKKFNIPLVHEMKQVGQGMQDNPCIAILVDSKPENRLPDPPQIAGITEDLKIIVEASILPLSINESRVNIAAKIAMPLSKGYLELNNTDPRLNPTVKFNYLENENDMQECIKMTKLLNKIARSKSIAFFLGESQQSKLVSTEFDLRKFCKKNVRTIYHYHGGCNVGTVLDKDYKVHGIKGLKVLDGSTFSESPGTNPMATLLMLGRYQGIKILQQRETESELNIKENR
ncbi:putative long-chain-alcohol oxidase, FAD/NAD(P)-binding domain-containing protein [Medicago truncatula]|uniref:Glucose-methanol-choline (GMC) oxidoreductase family protein n=1 Tax=Medicago truncatula TaxID=3880 RepID=G7KGL1_MEDTR|nr:protein HOTHEAD [Medicago truncatula]AES96777.1 glucose-methanol-choline (GMC) oxidoreductase family protein [Medicago truncatula]RHN55414.1 putative long-chain-alcohol oxidase, FAD/NAD(P)-binding domain-containing protein [Medicago truncatula]